MVLVWNELAGGDAEYCAAIVALNSLLTIALYPPFSLFFIVTLPAQLLGEHPPPDLALPCPWLVVLAAGLLLSGLFPYCIGLPLSSKRPKPPHVTLSLPLTLPLLHAQAGRTARLG